MQNLQIKTNLIPFLYKGNYEVFKIKLADSQFDETVTKVVFACKTLGVCEVMEKIEEDELTYYRLELTTTMTSNFNEGNHTYSLTIYFGSDKPLSTEGLISVKSLKNCTTCEIGG